MPRPPAPEETSLTSVRLPLSLLDRLDTEAARRQNATPSRTVTRAEVIRTGLYEWLDSVGA